MSHRAHRFTDPPTKANRFAWVGCWIRHRRARTGGLLSRLGCVRPPSAPAVPAAIPNATDTTPPTPVCPTTPDN